MLANVFENFRNMDLKIYDPDSARFVTAPGLALQAALKKTKVKLDLLTDVDMLLMVGKGVLEEEYLTLLINMPRLITNT